MIKNTYIEECMLFEMHSGEFKLLDNGVLKIVDNEFAKKLIENY